MKYLAATIKQTNSLARRLVKSWHGGEVIALSGDLGSGKTSFTQAVAKYLGITQPVTSPTFTIWQQYDCQHPKIKKLIHIDAYRLNSGADLINLGIDDWINKPDCLIVIEWPERVADWLPATAWPINFQHQPPGRLISWQTPKI
jgi:tRNA threonylcarbamoyladenosine biosynthesis protein TsaE